MKDGKGGQGSERVLGVNRGLFLFILFFSSTNFTEKAVDFSGIQTHTVGVDGKQADHLPTTTAHSLIFLGFKPGTWARSDKYFSVNFTLYHF